MPAKRRAPATRITRRFKRRKSGGMKPVYRAFARVRRPLALKTHNFVERCQPQTITVAQESAAVGLFRDFSLSQCLQVGNYTALFEYYKINKVVVEFRYKGTSTPAYTTINGTSVQNNELKNEINPVIMWKVDHNDVSADSIATLKQSVRTREHQLTNNRPNFTIQLKPAILAESYKTAISSAYAPKWGQWLSTSDDTIPHYGLKVYALAGDGNNANMGKVEVLTKIYFSVKCNE